MRTEVPFMDKVLSRLSKSQIDNFFITLGFLVWKINILKNLIRDNLSLRVITKRLSNLMEINFFENIS